MNTPLSKVRTGAYAGSHIGDHIADPKNGKAMRKSRSKSGISPKPEWATTISELRQRLNLSQRALGQRLHCTAMSVSRWERGTREPPGGTYIEVGNIAGAPLCWYFWGRAGLRNEDLMRVMPKVRRRLTQANAINFQIASAGSGDKTSKAPQLVAIPLLKVVAASHGEKGDRLGGKLTWHNHKWLESPVVSATVSTIRNVNCATTCNRFIAGLSQNKIRSSKVVQNLGGNRI
jgi:DNA-binding transcriptional regulator YiaG